MDKGAASKVHRTQDERDAGAHTEAFGPVPRRRAAHARASYTVFARFRRKRLRLASGIHSLESALSLADRLRRERFHDPQGIMVVDDHTDEVIDEAGALAALERKAGPEESAAEPPSVPLSAHPPSTPSPDQLEAIATIREAAEAARSAREKQRAILEARLDVVRSRKVGSEVEAEQLEQLIMTLRIQDDAAIVSLERALLALGSVSGPVSGAAEPEADEDLSKSA